MLSNRKTNDNNGHQESQASPTAAAGNDPGRENRQKDQLDILENELINQTSGGKADRKVLVPLSPPRQLEEGQFDFGSAEIEENSKIGENLQNKLSKMNEQRKRVNIVLDDNQDQDHIEAGAQNINGSGGMIPETKLES